MKKTTCPLNYSTDTMPIPLISSPLAGSSQFLAMDPKIPLSSTPLKTCQSKSSPSQSTTSGMTTGTNRKRPTRRILSTNPSRIHSKVTVFLVRSLYLRDYFGFPCLPVHHHHSRIHLLCCSLSRTGKTNWMDPLLSIAHSLRQILSIILRCSCNLSSQPPRN